MRTAWVCSIIVSSIIIGWSCKQGEGIISNELVPLQVLSLLVNKYNSSTSDTIFTNSYQYSAQSKFNIDNYHNVESVVFRRTLNTSDTSAYCFADLYSVADGATLAGTELRTNNVNEVTLSTNNLYNSLPKKELNLYARIRSGKKGVKVNCLDALIIISYR